MPYRKRYYKKKRYNRKKKCPKPRYFGQFGNDAYSMAKKALSMINVEYKCLDNQQTNVVVGTTPYILPLTNSVQGDTSISRDGDQIKITRFNFKALIKMNSSATLSQLRVLIIHDKQTNGAQFTGGNVLQDITADDAITSFNNLDNKYRFVTLFDRVYKLTPNESNQSLIRFNKSMQLKIRYGSNVGTIVDLNSDSLSLMMISNETVNCPAVTLYSRIRFVDN